MSCPVIFVSVNFVMFPFSFALLVLSRFSYKEALPLIGQVLTPFLSY